jgi:hypothetical protein
VIADEPLKLLLLVSVTPVTVLALLFRLMLALWLDDSPLRFMLLGEFSNATAC